MCKLIISKASGQQYAISSKGWGESNVIRGFFDWGVCQHPLTFPQHCTRVNINCYI